VIYSALPITCIHLADTFLPKRLIQSLHFTSTFAPWESNHKLSLVPSEVNLGQTELILFRML